jgi:hypothetical protein
MVRVRIVVLLWPIFLLLSGLSSVGNNPTTMVDASSASMSDHAATGSIAAATKIAIQNWRRYGGSCPKAFRDVFEGKYFWKMPADVELDVGPAVIHPLPATYLKATEQGSGQTKITPLAAGRLNVEGYRGGLPFPNPSDDATPPVRALGPSFHRSVPFLRGGLRARRHC